jgi:hypothetical protein
MVQASKLLQHQINVTAGVRNRLDRMAALVPPATKGQAPFEIYQGEALGYMHEHPEDEDFRGAYDAAYVKHQQTGGT